MQLQLNVETSSERECPAGREPAVTILHAVDLEIQNGFANSNQLCTRICVSLLAKFEMANFIGSRFIGQKIPVTLLI